MAATQALIGCLAFMVGLLAIAIPGANWLLLLLGVGATVGLHRVWRSLLPRRIWLIAGAIALFASFYYQWRMPHPAAQDISRLLTPADGAVKVLVTGRVTTLPRLTRSDKAQFWLQAQAIEPIGDRQPVTGKVYTTVPPEQAKALHPGQVVQVSGSLYLPKAAANPGGFDFKQYLQQEGSFAGLRGDQVRLQQDNPNWGWWQIQQRIVTAQQVGAGSPAGALISAMVLGGRAVDLPYDVKDAFVRVGLAHALAASGFQTSLLLGVVLALTRQRSPKLQFGLGSLALVGFVGLAGAQPAVLRAAVMGFGGLVALVLKRQVQPLGTLLLTAVLLLLLNPLWIWDLGFQLSFLATLGLLVTVTPIARRLDWLPTAIATSIAVPIAAYLWTFPLQLGAFGVLSPYSIPANVATTLLISGISLGGMVSALAALIWPPAGATLAWLLQYPTHLLLAIVRGFERLPGNGWAIGTIPVALVVGLYLLLSLCSWQRWWQRRWRWGLLLGIGLVLIPVAMGLTLTQATILATAQEPTLVLRDRGRVLVLGGSQAQTQQSTLLPYLQQVGVNQIDWAIAPQPDAVMHWTTVAARLPVRYVVQPPLSPASLQPTPTNNPQLIPVGLHQTATIGSTRLTWLSLTPAIAQLTLQGHEWLWLVGVDAEQQKAWLAAGQVPHAEVLWWSGQSLDPALVQAVQPRVAIASSRAIAPATMEWLQQQHLPLYITGETGALQWTPTAGFSPLAETRHGE